MYSFHIAIEGDRRCWLFSQVQSKLCQNTLFPSTGALAIFPFKSLPAAFNLLKCLLLLLFLPFAHWRNSGVNFDLTDSSKAKQWVGLFVKNHGWGHWLMSLSQSDVCGPSLVCSVATSVANFGPVHTHMHVSKIPHAQACVQVHVHNYSPACWLAVTFFRLMLM